MSRGRPAPLPRVEADPAAPLVLGIDTSCASDSLALARDGLVLASQQVRRPRRKGSALAVAIQRLLDAVNCAPTDLAAIAVVTGPGAFTGLRVGIATAQGLAAGLEIPTFASPATEAWAAGAPACGMPVAVTLDARRRQVYSALYRVDAEGLEELRGVRMEDPAAWLESLRQLPGVLLVGDGGRLYQELAREILGEKALVPSSAMMAPNVGYVALEGARRLAAGEQGERLEPVYLRDHDAAVAR
jgi:tRNA threonylcarbamoyladenosine biosynthesis protein TsaB